MNTADAVCAPVKTHAGTPTWSFEDRVSAKSLETAGEMCEGKSNADTALGGPAPRIYFAQPRASHANNTAQYFVALPETVRKIASPEVNSQKPVYLHYATTGSPIAHAEKPIATVVRLSSEEFKRIAKLQKLYLPAHENSFLRGPILRGDSDVVCQIATCLTPSNLRRSTSLPAKPRTATGRPQSKSIGVDAVDDQQRTLLHLAVLSGKTESVAALARLAAANPTAPLDRPDAMGIMPIEYAAASKNPEMVNAIGRAMIARDRARAEAEFAARRHSMTIAPRSRVGPC